MNHRITDEDIAKICISRFLRKISESFGVSVEVDGDSVVIDDENSLNVHHASKVVEAMVSLSKKDDIDDRLVDYFGFDYSWEHGTKEEILASGDDIYFAAFARSSRE